MMHISASEYVVSLLCYVKAGCHIKIPHACCMVHVKEVFIALDSDIFDTL
jgi:hypothetical protein